MEELVQDLVSSLEQSSEQTQLAELWEEMVLSPLQQRRQVRRRRGRKRRCDSASHAGEHGRCLSEASESSLDETAKDSHDHTASAPASALAPAPAPAPARACSSTTPANHSDSDDTGVPRLWCSFSSPVSRSRLPSWAESDSVTENTPGRPLRRRRKVKRMTSDVTVSLQQKLKVSELEGERAGAHRATRKQRLSRLKKSSNGWGGREREARGAGGPGGAGLMLEKSWKDRITREAKEQREASDETFSEGETSSVCSSDPGLFTNDEGRQGDDEQSDWFFEGECGAGVPSMLSSWDSDAPPVLKDRLPAPTFLQPAWPSQRGYQARLNSIRRGRRRLPNKNNTLPVSVERMKHFNQDPYQRDFWLPSIGQRDRRQFSPLCQLPVYPVDMVPSSSPGRWSSPVCRNRCPSVRLSSRQPSLHLLCSGDIKRRRKTSILPSTPPVCIPFLKEVLRGETPASSSPDLALTLASAPAFTLAPGPSPASALAPAHSPTSSMAPAPASSLAPALTPLVLETAAVMGPEASSLYQLGSSRQ